MFRTRKTYAGRMLLPFFPAFLLSEVKLMKVLFTPFIKIFMLPYVAKKIFLIKLMCFEAYGIISVFPFKNVQRVMRVFSVYLHTVTSGLLIHVFEQRDFPFFLSFF